MKNMFFGQLKCKNLIVGWRFVLSELTFFDLFEFVDCKFYAGRCINHWSFPVINEKVKKCRDTLARQLMEANVEENELMLSVKQEQEKNALLDKMRRRSIDPSIYEAQLLNKELDNKNAALYLGISTSKLEHLRSKDKEKVGRKSIPCYYNATRRIFYHLDALDAYKAKDWALLKAKRQEYKDEWQEVLGNKK